MIKDGLVADGALDRVRAGFNTYESTVRIGDTELRVLEVDPDDERLRALESDGLSGKGELPYWTKIWPATMMLANFISSRPVRPGARLLELGAGRGLPGLFAAMAGHRVTITDLSEQSLEFSKAIAELNDIGNAEHRILDWNDPGDLGRFEIIAGSEVLYLKSDYPAMVDFLQKHLAPGGEVFLSHGRWPISKEFFAFLGDDFESRRRDVVLRGEDGEEVTISLHYLCLRPAE